MRACATRVLSVYIAVVYSLYMRKSKVGVVMKVRRCGKKFEAYKTLERTEGSNLRPSPTLDIVKMEFNSLKKDALTRYETVVNQ